MTRDEAVEIATQAGRSNLAGHISALHEELDALHAKHGTKRGELVHPPHPASWGHADGEQRGLSAEEAQKEAAKLAADGFNARGVPLTTGKPEEEAPSEAAKPAAILDHDPALDAPLTDEEIRDINAQAMAKAGVEVPEDEPTSPEAFGLGSSTKPDHPDKKSHKKGGR